MLALTLSPAKTGLWHPKSVWPAAYSARIAPFHPLAVAPSPCYWSKAFSLWKPCLCYCWDPCKYSSGSVLRRTLRKDSTAITMATGGRLFPPHHRLVPRLADMIHLANNSPTAVAVAGPQKAFYNTLYISLRNMSPPLEDYIFYPLPAILQKFTPHAPILCLFFPFLCLFSPFNINLPLFFCLFFFFLHTFLFFSSSYFSYLFSQMTSTDSPPRGDFPIYLPLQLTQGLG